MRRIRNAATVMALAAAGIAASATATLAAYPTSDYHIDYGNSQLIGTITWYNRSVNAAATNKAYGCRTAGYAFYNSAWQQIPDNNSFYTRTVCDQTKGHSFTVDFGSDAPYHAYVHYGPDTGGGPNYECDRSASNCYYVGSSAVATAGKSATAAQQAARAKALRLFSAHYQK